MKTLTRSTLILAILATAAAQVRAGEYFSVAMDAQPALKEQGRPWEHHHLHDHRDDGVGVDAYPVNIPLAPPPTFPGKTGDYVSDLANFNEKLSRSRAIVRRQTEKQSISAESSYRLMNVLDGIERDARGWAFDNLGNLTDENFTDLYRRLNQTNEDIQIALAE